MENLMQALPGIVTPIGEVTKKLAEMWQVEFNPNADAPSEFRASQMNLVLHFGRETTIEEAKEAFDTAITFAQRYPCRIIVLCPEEADAAQEKFLEAKLYVQCFIGETQRQMCCCEALILSYYVGKTEYLENQVSVWMENDLPTYYWIHKISANRVQNEYMPVISKCSRVVYDSSIEKDDLSQVNWPFEGMSHDLAHARLLVARQSIGQFLSAYTPETITTDCIKVRMRHNEALKAEGALLARWANYSVQSCAALAGVNAPPMEVTPESEEVWELYLEFQYNNEDKFFRWSFDVETGTATIQCCFGNDKQEMPLKVKLLDPEKALSEALFFEENTNY